MKLTQSRENLLRRVKSIGVDDQLLINKKDFQFETLKYNKRVEMGQFLRDKQKIVELFGFRDQNASSNNFQDKEQQKEQIVVEDLNDSLQRSQMLESMEYLSKMSCLRCKDSFVQVPRQLNRKELELKNWALRAKSKEKRVRKEQKILQKHQILQNKDLPPLLFQNHIKKPPGYSIQGSVKELKNEKQGRLQFGRIAEGIDEDQLQLLMKQKMIPYLKRQNNSQPNLRQKQMNVFKCKHSGNVLGKAYSKLRIKDNDDQINEELERQLIQEKERQINELIFGNRDSYQQFDMQEFI